MDAADLPAEVVHPDHPGCTLRLVAHRPGDAAITFRCDGCREPGEGTRYVSVVDDQPTNHVLHTHCALATPTLQHPLVKGTLVLWRDAPTGDDAVVCDACYGAVRGLHYHCSKKTKRGEYTDLHPCCAKLPLSITVDQEGTATTTFELRAEVAHRCTSCREMEWYYRPWCYRSTDPKQRVYLHVNCIKEIMARSGGAGVHMGGSSSSGGAGSGEDDDDGVIVRLRERAGRSGSSNLVKRICEVLLILMRVVIGVLLGDPTGPLLAVNFVMP